MSERPTLLYFQDIQDSGKAILAYVDGVDYESFRLDRMRCAAVIREFEIIGEAVGKLPEEVKTKHPEVAWQDIKDFRNLLIHEYFGVDLQIVWNVIQQELPQLLEVVTGMTVS